jgi:hypothetical protein
MKNVPDEETRNAIRERLKAAPSASASFGERCAHWSIARTEYETVVLRRAGIPPNEVEAADCEASSEELRTAEVLKRYREGEASQADVVNAFNACIAWYQKQIAAERKRVEKGVGDR